MKYIAVLKSGYEQTIETEENFSQVWFRRVHCIGENIKTFEDDKGVSLILDEVAVVKKYSSSMSVTSSPPLAHWNTNINIEGASEINELSKKIAEVLNKVHMQPRDFSSSLR